MTDALSDVLRSVRLKGGIFLDARFTAPWCVDSYLTAETCRPILERPAHMIGYHFILEGGMRFAVEGEPALELNAGEIVLVPRNDRHTLSSAAGMKPIDGHDLVQPSPDGGLAQVNYGGGGALTRIVCGFLGCEDIHHPLLDSLPRILRVDFREATSRDLIETSLKFAAGELAEGRLASSDLLSRLSELLLVEAVRSYAATLDGDRTGWLRGLRDPQIGRALSLMHQDIAAPWTAESLAKEVALSRSGFIERFTGLVGMPPIRYLTAWRMETAKLQLRETTRSIAQIAHAVGYDAEEAFSRAFKREVGVSPAPWREQVG
jgi:AraC-like DNA-binding protein